MPLVFSYLRERRARLAWAAAHALHPADGIPPGQPWWRLLLAAPFVLGSMWVGAITIAAWMESAGAATAGLSAAAVR